MLIRWLFTIWRYGQSVQRYIFRGVNSKVCMGWTPKKSAVNVILLFTILSSIYLLRKSWMYITNSRDVFSIQSNIKMELCGKIVNRFQPLIFLHKKTPSQMFNWVLNKRLNSVNETFKQNSQNDTYTAI